MVKLSNGIAPVRKLCLIYSLNVVDWICTITLLNTGDFYEANPLMNPIIGSLPLGFFVKCILPAILLLVIYRMCSELGQEEMTRVDWFISFVIVLYTALCVVHIVNFLIFRFG